jgi:hypothetical protein
MTLPFWRSAAPQSAARFAGCSARRLYRKGLDVQWPAAPKHPFGIVAEVASEEQVAEEQCDGDPSGVANHACHHRMAGTLDPTGRSRPLTTATMIRPIHAAFSSRILSLNL